MSAEIFVPQREGLPQMPKLLVPRKEDFTKISEKKAISPDYIKTVDGQTLYGTWAQVIWLVHQLGKPYSLPTTEDLDEMADKTGILPDYEGTRTLVLIPDTSHRLSERVAGKIDEVSKQQRPYLKSNKYPIAYNDLVPVWNEKELDRFEIVNIYFFRPYEELLNAITLLGKSDFVYVHGWKNGLPISFGEIPNPQYKNARVSIFPKYQPTNAEGDDKKKAFFDFGERPVMRGVWYSDPGEARFGVGLNWSPSAPVWRFRIILEL